MEVGALLVALVALRAREATHVAMHRCAVPFELGRAREHLAAVLAHQRLQAPRPALLASVANALALARDGTWAFASVGGRRVRVRVSECDNLGEIGPFSAGVRVDGVLNVDRFVEVAQIELLLSLFLVVRPTELCFSPGRRSEGVRGARTAVATPFVVEIPGEVRSEGASFGQQQIHGLFSFGFHVLIDVGC